MRKTSVLAIAAAAALAGSVAQAQPMSGMTPSTDLGSTSTVTGTASRLNDMGSSHPRAAQNKTKPPATAPSSGEPAAAVPPTGAATVPSAPGSSPNVAPSTDAPPIGAPGPHRWG